MIDRATLLGLTATLALIAWVIGTQTGGGVAAFWNGPAAALVIGGAVCTTLVAFPWRRFWSFGGIVKNVVVVRNSRPEDLIATIVALAHVARRDGLLSLEKPVEELEDDFLKRALRMAVDGADARTIDMVCHTELEATDARHATGSGLLESVGRAAPVFGMLGTVIGLIVMLGTIEDPSKLGPGMSVALLTTLYGLIMANVFCLPLARKLTHRSSEELLSKTIALAGVMAIQAGDNPRIVEQKLRAYLPAGAKLGARQAAPVPASQRRSRVANSLRHAARLNPLAGWLRRRGGGARSAGSVKAGATAPVPEERESRQNALVEAA